MNKRKKLMNKPVYLGLSKLKLSKISMYQFYYDYRKPKCGQIIYSYSLIVIL